MTSASIGNVCHIPPIKLVHLQRGSNVVAEVGDDPDIQSPHRVKDCCKCCEVLGVVPGFFCIISATFVSESGDDSSVSVASELQGETTGTSIMRLYVTLVLVVLAS